VVLFKTAVDTFNQCVTFVSSELNASQMFYHCFIILDGSVAMWHVKTCANLDGTLKAVVKELWSPLSLPGHLQ